MKVIYIYGSVSYTHLPQADSTHMNFYVCFLMHFAKCSYHTNLCLFPSSLPLSARSESANSPSGGSGYHFKLPVAKYERIKKETSISMSLVYRLKGNFR